MKIGNHTPGSFFVVDGVKFVCAEPTVNATQQWNAQPLAFNVTEHVTKTAPTYYVVRDERGERIWSSRDRTRAMSQAVTSKQKRITAAREMLAAYDAALDARVKELEPKD